MVADVSSRSSPAGGISIYAGLRGVSLFTVSAFVFGFPLGRGASRCPRLRGVSLCCAPCKVLVFSGCNSHPATGSLQPVAIGAAVEVTKPSEPSRQLYRLAMQRADRP